MIFLYPKLKKLKKQRSACNDNQRASEQVEFVRNRGRARRAEIVEGNSADVWSPISLSFVGGGRASSTVYNLLCRQ